MTRNHVQNFLLAAHFNILGILQHSAQVIRSYQTVIACHCNDTFVVLPGDTSSGDTDIGRLNLVAAGLFRSLYGIADRLLGFVDVDYHPLVHSFGRHIPHPGDAHLAVIAHFSNESANLGSSDIDC